jgi:hypothetical protein
MGVNGLERFGLTDASFRRLGNRRVLADVYLRTYDATPAVRRLPPSKRFAYLAARVDRWIKNIKRVYPKLLNQQKYGRDVRLSESTSKHSSQLPYSLSARGSAREILALAAAAGVSDLYVTKVKGHRLRSIKSPLEWYCVRAFIVILVERSKSTLQTTEDRFILVRATSSDEAKNLIRRQWRGYARPYLNSDMQMVSWKFDRVVDVYETSVEDIDPAGTEVYSKLCHRKMRPKYVWRP